jgi:hypothetical protein
MKTFKNKNFKGINYYCTNVIFCIGENAPTDNWVECSPTEMDMVPYLSKLYVSNEITYFGIM